MADDDDFSGLVDGLDTNLDHVCVYVCCIITQIYA